MRQLKELETLLAPIEQKYSEFQDLLTEEERALEAAEQLFLSDCGGKKSQLLRNEQQEYEKSPLFQAFLEKINEKFKEATRKTICFAYAWPTDSRYEKESWVQPFLKNLQAHLTKAGFPIVQLDIVSNRYGANIYEFMEGARTSRYVLLFGTESLLDKFSKGISAVCTELIHILRKREEDGKKNVHRVFPILLSGEHRSAFPPEYERFITIRDWRNHSYLHNFQQLFLELLGLPLKDYQSKLEKYWKDLSPLEAPSISDWYQRQREAVDTCRGNNNREELLAIEVSHNLPLSADETPSQPIFIERLKEHYTTRSTISVLTFRKKGKWELTLPVESLYTKLAMITEEERKERSDLSKLDDGRLPTHETIFKAKKEVTPEEILKLAKGKRAVIHGSAGIGKTTFTTMLLYKWANGELFTEFQTVFCIRLRNLTKNFYPKGPVYHAADILNREYESLGLDRLDSDPQTTLLILDGWDELPPETREGGHLARAFQELQEHYPNLLITSRPGAIDVDATEFEILGFSDQQIGVYTDRFFHTDASKATGIKRFIQQNPLARSLAHIPINLSILCALYDEDDTLFNSKTSLTISALYDRIINQFYKIFLLRRGISQNEVRSSPFLSMHPKVEPLASCLEEIAYNASLKEEIYTNEREFILVYKKGLEIEDVRKLGLFRIENNQGSFIHLTFQEYFAAIYISRFYESPEIRSQAQEIVRKIKFNGKFVRILSMVAGILSNSENQEVLQSYFDDLHSEPRDLVEIYELTLLARCFEECDSPTNLSQYAGFIDRVKQLVKSSPLEEQITNVFRGNQKLFFHPDIVTLFNKLLSHENTLQYALSILKEITSYSATLPREIFQKLEEYPYEKASQIDIVSILENIAGEEARKNLITLLANPKVDQYVRGSAAFALGKIASGGERIGEKGVEALITLLADPKVDQDVRGSAASALGKIASGGERIGEKGVEALISLITDTGVSQYVRRSAAETLVNIASADEGMGEKGVKDLITLLADPKVDPYVRKSAAEVIGEIASAGEKIGKKRVKALISLIADPKVDPYVRKSAVKTLGNIALADEGMGKKCVKALISLITDTRVSQYVRRSAAETLVNIASADEGMGEKGVKDLITLLADPKVDPFVRKSAAEAIGEIASAGEKIGEKGIEALITLLADPKVDPFVRKSAVEALGEIASAGEKIGKKGIGALINLLSDPNVKEYVNYGPEEELVPAAKAVGKIAAAGERVGKEGIQALIKLLSSREVCEYVRSLAAKALGLIASAGESVGKNGIQALINLLSNLKVAGRVCSSAAEALGEIASGDEEIGEEGIGALINLLSDPKVGTLVHSTAAEALGKIASGGKGIGEKGIQSLIHLLSDSKVATHVRSSAAEVLGKIASGGEEIGEEGIGALIAFLSDSKVADHMRSSAAEVLGKIASGGKGIGEEGVKALIALLSDPKVSEYLIFSVAEVLGKIASGGKGIGEKGIQALIALLSDSKVSKYLRFSVAEAIEYISPSDMIKFHAGNEEFLRWYCLVTQRALIKENEKCIIRSQIK